MKKDTHCRCPGCSCLFNAKESSYSATRLDVAGSTLHIKEILLCKDCSNHATQKTPTGRKIIDRLLIQAKEVGPSGTHVVH